MVTQESQHHLLNESLDLECHIYRMLNVFIFFQTCINIYIYSLSNPGFLNLNTIDILGQMSFFVVEGCHVQCKILNSIPGLSLPIRCQQQEHACMHTCMHVHTHTHTHTHTHILVIYKKGKKRRKVSRFSIHPLGDKNTPLEND